ncbi:hypothetical protein GRJ2_000428500 [Grus japonensis]|uniref:Uncharacterized protein n=1 Tax=Grus japonensis TaxID=30415 RepID=A0ABC9W699_GRUJA
MPVSFGPIQKKKYTKKSVHLGRNDDEPGPSREQEEEAEPEEVRQLKDDTSYLPPVQTSISAIKSEHSSAQERKYRGTTWFYLHDHGDNMRKWDGKPTYLNPTGIRGSQQFPVLEATGSLTRNEWQKHPIVTGPEAPCILGIDYLRRGCFKDPKGYWWAFGIAALEMEEIKQLSSLPDLLENPSVMGLFRVEEQQVPITTTTVHWRQYCTNQDSLIPIHKLIRQPESQGVISKTCSPFNSPIWPVRKSNREWRLTVNYRGLNEVMPPLSPAMLDMLELQYELESKADK